MDSQLRCSPGNTYSLVVEIATNTKLKNAWLHWRVGGKESSRSMGLSTDGKQATVVVSDLVDDVPIAWWVRATALDGRLIQTSENRNLSPC